MLSPVRVFAPNDNAMCTELVYTYIASLIGRLLTPPSHTLCCVAPFCLDGGGGCDPSMQRRGVRGTGFVYKRGGGVFWL